MRSTIMMLALAGSALISLPALAESLPPAAVKEATAAKTERPFIPKEQWDKLPAAEKEKIKAERKTHWNSLSAEEKEKLKAERRERWEKLPPEEKERIKAERKERWEKLPPEEKEKRRAEMRKRYDEATPEEKEKIRARMEERRKTREGENHHNAEMDGQHELAPAGGKN